MESLVYFKFQQYSRDFFPNRSSMVSYLNDFAQASNLNIQYNTVIQNITRQMLCAADDDACRSSHTPAVFVMSDQYDNKYRCR